MGMVWEIVSAAETGPGGKKLRWTLRWLLAGWASCGGHWTGLKEGKWQRVGEVGTKYSKYSLKARAEDAWRRWRRSHPTGAESGWWVSQNEWEPRTLVPEPSDTLLHTPRCPRPNSCQVPPKSEPGAISGARHQSVEGSVGWSMAAQRLICQKTPLISRRDSSPGLVRVSRPVHVPLPYLGTFLTPKP